MRIGKGLKKLKIKNSQSSFIYSYIDFFFSNFFPKNYLLIEFLCYSKIKEPITNNHLMLQYSIFLFLKIN